MVETIVMSDEACLRTMNEEGEVLSARERAGVEAAQRRCAAAETRRGAGAGSPDPKPLFDAARRSRTRRQRVVWLQRWASATVKPFESEAACRPGCDHCCSLPLVVSRTEALILSAASGRELVEPADGIVISQLDLEKQMERLDALGKPVAEGRQRSCPFLSSRRCSVYERRPAACRLHLSMDDDDTLCRPHPSGNLVRAPYLDVRGQHAAILLASVGDVVADIRSFFPSAAPAQEDDAPFSTTPTGS